jgi:hypothetical protein
MISAGLDSAGRFMKGDQGGTPSSSFARGVGKGGDPWICLEDPSHGHSLHSAALAMDDPHPSPVVLLGDIKVAADEVGDLGWGKAVKIQDVGQYKLYGYFWSDLVVHGWKTLTAI